ncbi:MAG: hypothetical protein IPK16_03980 [Anaerolineales bacterium]|nr:hypothetical protein [Anaerolineales bacterium]
MRNSDTWGVIKMTLHEGSYDWEFVPIPGQTWTDSGTANCVTAPGVPTAPAVTTPTVEPAVAVNPVADSADTGDFTLVSSGATPTLASVPAGAPATPSKRATPFPSSAPVWAQLDRDCRSEWVDRSLDHSRSTRCCVCPASMT